MDLTSLEGIVEHTREFAEQYAEGDMGDELLDQLLVDPEAWKTFITMDGVYTVREIEDLTAIEPDELAGMFAAQCDFGMKLAVFALAKQRDERRGT